MNAYFRSAFALAIVTFVTAGMAASASAADAALRLPVTGTARGGVDFAGTVTINRFAVQDNDIVAIGFVSGVLTRGNKPLGTVVAGEVTWPVTVRSAASVATARIGAITPAQAICPVVQIALGPLDINLLGFQVALGAITFDVVGEEGTPLGDLVCEISDLLGIVADVVGLLNSLLGLLTGLLGGIGGLLPTP